MHRRVPKRVLKWLHNLCCTTVPKVERSKGPHELLSAASMPRTPKWRGAKAPTSCCQLHQCHALQSGEEQRPPRVVVSCINATHSKVERSKGPHELLSAASMPRTHSPAPVVPQQTVRNVPPLCHPPGAEGRKDIVECARRSALCIRSDDQTVRTPSHGCPPPPPQQSISSGLHTHTHVRGAANKQTSTMPGPNVNLLVSWSGTHTA